AALRALPAERLGETVDRAPGPGQVPLDPVVGQPGRALVADVRPPAPEVEAADVRDRHADSEVVRVVGRLQLRHLDAATGADRVEVRAGRKGGGQVGPG